MFLPRNDYDLIKGFDKNYFLHVDDLDFCLRFSRAGGGIYFAPDVPVTHIGGTSKVTSDFVERHKAKGFVYYFHYNFGNEYPLVFLWALDLSIWARYFLRRLLSKKRK
jgi:GT2 family glycosyltransferase